MTQLEVVRNDISNIITGLNEFATNVLYTEEVKTFDDDNSLNGTTNISKTIIVSFQPENNGTLKIDNLGNAIIGTAKVFFKHEYVFSDLTLIPKIDGIILINSILYRITKLTPHLVNTGVAYYESMVTREDMN